MQIMDKWFINVTHFRVGMPNWQVYIILSLRYIIETNTQYYLVHGAAAHCLVIITFIIQYYAFIHV